MRLELCSDHDPLEVLHGLPDRITEALEPIEELHTGTMTFDVGYLVAEAETLDSNCWGSITRTELVDMDVDG